MHSENQPFLTVITVLVILYLKHDWWVSENVK